MEDYYTILSVPSSSTIEQIKKSYRKLAKKCHSDKNPNKDTTAAFQQLICAWEHLGDPAKKQIYDAERERGVRNVTRVRKDAEASRAREESLRRKREEEDLEAHRARAAKEKEEWAARHMKKNPEVQAKKAASRKRDVPQSQGPSANPVKSSREAQEESRRNGLFRLGLTEKQVNRRMKQERHRKVEEDVPEDTLWGKPEEDAQAHEESQITPFRLFDLPPEIVDMIYSYILPRTPNKKRSHAFLRAVSINDNLHQAAMKVFYQINTFEFQVTQGGPLCKTRKEVLEAMNRITFDISSSVIPVTNVSPNITLALNIKHLTLRASADLGLNIIISRYVFKFKKLKTLTVYHKRKRGIANQVYSLFQPKDISQNSIKQNWITELNYMLGGRGVRQDDGTWVWITKRDCFEMKRKSRHIKFE